MSDESGKRVRQADKELKEAEKRLNPEKSAKSFPFVAFFRRLNDLDEGIFKAKEISNQIEKELKEVFLSGNLTIDKKAEEELWASFLKRRNDNEVELNKKKETFIKSEEVIKILKAKRETLFDVFVKKDVILDSLRKFLKVARSEKRKDKDLYIIFIINIIKKVIEKISQERMPSLGINSLLENFNEDNIEFVDLLIRIIEGHEFDRELVSKIISYIGEEFSIINRELNLRYRTTVVSLVKKKFAERIKNVNMSSFQRTYAEALFDFYVDNIIFGVLESRKFESKEPVIFEISEFQKNGRKSVRVNISPNSISEGIDEEISDKLLISFVKYLNEIIIGLNRTKTNLTDKQ